MHAVSQTVENDLLPPDSRMTLLLDFTNAFNSIDRGHMFDEVRNQIPALSSWVESCYTFLHFGDNTILSCCGVQQGDPLGPLCFALTLQPVVNRIENEIPGLLVNSWYLDDGTLCGHVEDLSRALSIVEEDGPPRGLMLNRSKSLLYMPECSSVSNDLLPQNIPITRSGFCLLGSPIGPADFCDPIVGKRVDKIKAAVSNLRFLEDSQMETTLLRSCLSFTKFNFVLRCCPPTFINNATLAFDDLMRDTLCDLAGGPLSDWAWKKATLPSSMGGLNLRSAHLHAPAAFISSLNQCNSLISQILDLPVAHSPHMSSSIVPALALAAEMPEWLSIEDIDVPLVQKNLSHKIDEASYNSLVASAPDLRSRALALSTAIPHAGDWLNVCLHKPLACISMTENLGSAWIIGWVSG